MLAPFTDDYHREILKHVTSEDCIVLQAKYHKECYVNLYNDFKEKFKNPKPSRSEKIDQAMEDIYNYMLTSDECQFSIQQLMEAVNSDNICPHEDTIKNRLKSKFGDQIVISSRMGGTTYVCFANNLYDILTDSWYNARKNNIEEEEEDRLIDAASELIRRKIRSSIYRMDEYPASSKILMNINENIPIHLLKFLNNIIYKDKTHNEENEKCYSRKITSIAHAIISAARPKSFISPLLLATGATLYRKFGSKNMIEL